MVSQAQFSANRANARKSTGPRTAEGKKRSSRNATTHGVYCKDVVLEGENRTLFEILRNQYIESLNPQDALQLSFADRVLESQWKLNRIQAAERWAIEAKELAMAKHLHDRDEDDEDDDTIRAPFKQFWERIDESLEDKSADELVAWLADLKLHHVSFVCLMQEEKTCVLEKLAKMRVHLEHTISRALRELRMLQTKPKDPKPQIKSPYLDEDDDVNKALIQAVRREEEEYWKTLGEEEEEDDEEDEGAQVHQTPVSEGTHEDPDPSANRTPDLNPHPECPPMSTNVAKCRGRDAKSQNEPNLTDQKDNDDRAEEEMLR